MEISSLIFLLYFKRELSELTKKKRSEEISFIFLKTVFLIFRKMELLVHVNLKQHFCACYFNNKMLVHVILLTTFLVHFIFTKDILLTTFW